MMSSVSKSIVVLLMVALGVALLAGCGGSSAPAEVSTAAASPWAGAYYCWSYNGSIATVVSILNVGPDGAISVAAGGPILHGAWSGTGTVTTAGDATFKICNAQIATVWGGGTSNINFTGKFVKVGGIPQASGKFVWSKFGTTKIVWRARKLTLPANANTWSFKLGDVAGTYAYEKAFAVLGEWGGKTFLVMAFEGPRSTWPAESMIVTADPQLVDLNKPAPTFISALWLGDTAANWYRHSQASEFQPNLVMTARNLVKGGYVTGRVTGFMKKYANTTKLTFTSAPVRKVKIIDQVDLGE